ncbi:transporter substrate-binding domain-containing diguanylate cyclase [Paratissierella segnis]|uniref:GGDEF domain-containing protein n=1 Tax=Paratissierella segnis TaxID=2763679 RepID=A0A926ESP1_9FIRM|nr:GGDEF domain-containing protein [Paratissierella segnis]MBC8587810.1 GGDEF domain-containing protein [Paratissierella segnis]
MKYSLRKNKSIIFIISFLFILGTAFPTEAMEFLTEEEKAYIADRTVIKAAFMQGAAPISFVNSNNEVSGISKRVLDEVSSMTGLVFKYTLCGSAEEITSDTDIVCAIPKNYAPKNMKLSKPFLKSETILYINSSVDPDSLDDKIYAAIGGSDLPNRIKEENTIYFNTREDCLDAVEKGKADYGYGNAYSVAYYSIQNNYKNIVTIPMEMEPREYCVGFLNDDEMLFSIINKAMSLIDEARLQTLILDVASNIERKITLNMVMDAYGKEIIAIIGVTIIILLYSVISNIRANKRLSIENKRYEVLSIISNEFLYEYNMKSKRLILSENCTQLFGKGEVFYEADAILKNFLSNNEILDISDIIRLPLINGEMGVFKLISLSIYNSFGKTDTIIGKLIDISTEVAEKEKLLTRSQIDGLSGLYNSSTTKEYIIERINSRESNVIDAFILMDCDDFKEINDTHGHLAGDKFLEYLGRTLEQTFRKTDIIGRIGGDEFCVYLKNVSSIEVVKEKCNEVNLQLKEFSEEENVSVSIGVVLVNDNVSYETMFKQADDALYQAKRNGKGQFSYNCLYRSDKG